MSNDDDVKSLLSLACASSTGVVVTAFPTRDAHWRARLDAEGHGVYTLDYKSLAELFAKLGALVEVEEQQRKKARTPRRQAKQ